jgi:hypothetical protein
VELLPIALEAIGAVDHRVGDRLVEVAVVEEVGDGRVIQFGRL